MSFSFLCGLLIFLLSVPLWNFEIYRKAWQWEARQIAADNAVIRWGKADRQMARYLESSNKMVRALELIHHPLHLCAKVPATMPECLPKDEGIELELKQMHEAAGRAARWLWRRGTAEGREAVLNEKILRLVRSDEPPIQEEACHVCGGHYFWRIDTSHPGMMSSLSLRTPQRLRAAVELVRDRGEWNYQVHAGEE